MSEYWQVEKTELWEQNEYILQESLWTDCIFKVSFESSDEQEFHCHKVILSKASPVFATMFYGALPEKQIIKVTDINPEIFKKLIRYIYTHKIDSYGNQDDILELCYAAKKYMLQNIVDTCSHKLWEELTPSNVCQGYEFATVMEVPSMQDRCMKMIRENTSSIIEDPSFLSIELTTLAEILKQDTLMISSEAEIIQAAERWAENQIRISNLNPEDKRQILGTVFFYLRFVALTVEEFMNGPLKSNMLTSDEKVTILNMINSKDTQCQNFGLCLIRNSRLKPITEIQFTFKNSSCTSNFDSERYIHNIDFSVNIPIQMIGIEFGNICNIYSELGDKNKECVLILNDITMFEEYTVKVTSLPEPRASPDKPDSLIITFDYPVKIKDSRTYRFSLIYRLRIKIGYLLSCKLIDLSKKNKTWKRYADDRYSFMNIIYKHVY